MARPWAGMTRSRHAALGARMPWYRIQVVEGSWDQSRDARDRIERIEDDGDGPSAQGRGRARRALPSSCQLSLPAATGGRARIGRAARAGTVVDGRTEEEVELVLAPRSAPGRFQIEGSLAIDGGARVRTERDVAGDGCGGQPARAGPPLARRLPGARRWVRFLVEVSPHPVLSADLERARTGRPPGSGRPVDPPRPPRPRRDARGPRDSPPPRSRRPVRGPPRRSPARGPPPGPSLAEPPIRAAAARAWRRSGAGRLALRGRLEARVPAGVRRSRGGKLAPPRPRRARRPQARGRARPPRPGRRQRSRRPGPPGPGARLGRGPGAAPALRRHARGAGDSGRVGGGSSRARDGLGLRALARRRAPRAPSDPDRPRSGRWRRDRRRARPRAPRRKHGGPGRPPPVGPARPLPPRA